MIVFLLFVIVCILLFGATRVKGAIAAMLGLIASLLIIGGIAMSIAPLINGIASGFAVDFYDDSTIGMFVLFIVFYFIILAAMCIHCLFKQKNDFPNKKISLNTIVSMVMLLFLGLSIIMLGEFTPDIRLLLIGFFLCLISTFLKPNHVWVCAALTALIALYSISNENTYIPPFVFFVAIAGGLVICGTSIHGKHKDKNIKKQENKKQ